jgi:hypothetical protein
MAKPNNPYACRRTTDWCSGGRKSRLLPALTSLKNACWHLSSGKRPAAMPGPAWTLKGPPSAPRPSRLQPRPGPWGAVRLLSFPIPSSGYFGFSSAPDMADRTGQSYHDDHHQPFEPWYEALGRARGLVVHRKGPGSYIGIVGPVEDPGR